MRRHPCVALGLAIGGVLAVAGSLAAQTPPAPPPPTTPPTATPQATPMPALDESRRVQADAIDRLLADGKTLLLDVREPKEIQEFGTIEGAINIPIGQLEKRMGELPKDRVILTA